MLERSGASFVGSSAGPEIARIERDRIVFRIDEPVRKRVSQFIDETRAANRDANVMQRLKEIGLGLQNFHDGYKHFPNVAIRDPQGKPLLSWRVAILPYLDCNKLYKQFHLNEPWDSEHNRKLIEEMPDVFRSGQIGPGRTRFLAPVGPTLGFSPDAGGLNLKTFSDGSSLTILVVEADADHAVVWTKPDDLPVDLENPRRGLTDGETNFFAGFADSSANRLKGSIRPEVLRALLTRNAGDKVNREEINPAP